MEWKWEKWVRLRDFEEARWIRVGDPPIVRAKGEGEMENSSQVLVLDDK